MSSSSEPIRHVSDTSLWVAVHRGREGDRPDALFKDPLALVLAGERGVNIARTMSAQKVMGWIMAMRTVSIDQLIKNAIDRGVDTVLNLGAGLDTRPYRLQLPAGLKWIEVDFPGIIELKESKLKDETPHIPLERISLDLSNRSEAQALFHRIGSQSKSTLVITEGVIPYLTDVQAGNLADDLRAVPTFHYWIQDFRIGGLTTEIPKKILKGLKLAPFQFTQTDWFGFFQAHGWKVNLKVLFMDEGQKHKRPFPLDFPWSLLMHLMPKDKREKFRNSNGVALFEKNS